MATHYSRMGDTSMENPETQEIDNDNDRRIFKETISFNS